MNTIAPNTIVDLVEALRARCAAIVEPLWGFETKTSDARAPQIVGGWLPPKTTSEPDRFSFVIVRPRNGNDSAEGADQDARATFDFVIGVYSDTDTGWIDALLVVEAMRQSFEGQPLIANTAFEHVGPLAWDLPEEQPRPQWMAVVTTTFLIPRPRRVTPEV